MSDLRPFCPYCQKYGDEMDEYLEAADDNDMDVSIYIRMEEGIYNWKNGHFACTPCYIKIGMPSSRQGWICP